MRLQLQWNAVVLSCIINSLTREKDSTANDVSLTPVCSVFFLPGL